MGNFCYDDTDIKSRKDQFVWLFHATDRLFRNIGKSLPIYVV
jgi:hypothetical protein